MAHFYFHWLQPWLFVGATAYLFLWSQPRTTTRFAAIVLSCVQAISCLVNIAGFWPESIHSWLTSDIASASSVVAGTAIALRWRLNGDKPWWMLVLVGLYLLQIMGRASHENPWMVAAYLNILNALQLLLVRSAGYLERITAPLRFRMRHPAGRRRRVLANGVAKADLFLRRIGGEPR